MQKLHELIQMFLSLEPASMVAVIVAVVFFLFFAVFWIAMAVHETRRAHAPPRDPPIQPDQEWWAYQKANEE